MSSSSSSYDGRPGQKRSAAAAELDLDDLPEDIDEEQIQRMLVEADSVHVETLTINNLKRVVAQFEKKIKKNQEMRIKYPDEPEKFLKSEVDVDEELKKLKQLAVQPELYAEFVTQGGSQLLVQLLGHANTDIAVSVMDVLNDLTDPDTVAHTPQPEQFIDTLLNAQLPELSVDTLLRINEEASPEDAQAVSNTLAVVENLTDLQPEVCARYTKVPKFLPWLLKRLRQGQDVDYNKLYAVEILNILLQNSPECREAIGRAPTEGIDKLLRTVAVYRKRDPVGIDEEEFVQNLFDALCSLMLVPQHQVAFGKAQGLELTIRMMKERKFSCRLALKLTNYAVNNCPANCNIFVEKLGLKPLFAMLMQKGSKAKRGSPQEAEEEEHVTAIIQSLCRGCTGMATARVINKFVEEASQKVERLLELHDSYKTKVKEGEARFESRTTEELEELETDPAEQRFLDKCEAGLFTLQQVDIVIVRLANMGNQQVSQRLLALLDIKGVAVDEVVATVEEYCQHLGDTPVAQEEKKELEKFAKNFRRQKEKFDQIQA